jgi:hypothetical protein
MIINKQDFITQQAVPFFKTLSAGTKGNWGKMNAQQAIEHIADFFKVSSGKLIFTLHTPEALLPRYKEFLFSDTPFRENTRAPETVVPKEPFALRNDSFTAATDELQNEITGFVHFFSDNPNAKTLHPVFGELNFEEWILLHFKHVMHHAKQFGLIA